MPKVRHDRAWVSERPKIRPKPNWTPEEDEKLLELKPKLLHGKWEKISIELGHTPYDCVERWTELSQQFLRAKEQQQKEPKLMFFPSEIWDPQSSRSASQLVSEAHKEAVNSLSRSGSAQLGIVAADNSTLRATTKNDAAMISSVRNILGSVFNISVDNQMFDPAIIKLRECEEKAVELSKERDQLVKQKDSAIQEAFLWRAELEKARDHVAFLEEAVRGAEERARNAEINAEAKDMEQRNTATLVEKQLLMVYINALQAQVQSQQQMETKEVCEKTESPSDMSDTRSLTKHVDSSDENVDKPCLSISKSVPITEDGDLRISEQSQGIVHPTDDNQWNDIQATESTISDVREVATDDRPA